MLQNAENQKKTAKILILQSQKIGGWSVNGEAIAGDNIIG